MDFSSLDFPFRLGVIRVLGLIAFFLLLLGDALLSLRSDSSTSEERSQFLLVGGLLLGINLSAAALFSVFSKDGRARGAGGASSSTTILCHGLLILLLFISIFVHAGSDENRGEEDVCLVALIACSAAVVILAGRRRIVSGRNSDNQVKSSQ